MSNLKSKKNHLISNLLVYGLISLFVLLIIVLNMEYVKKQLYDTFIYKNSYKKIIEGLINTLIIASGGLTIGIFIGLVISIIDVAKGTNLFLMTSKKIIRLYITVMRGTPITVQLLVIYYIILSSFSGKEVLIALIAMGLNSGAYVSEIMRGGIGAVPIGQHEAGRSLGLSYTQTMVHIIFPQAFKNTLPSIGNEFISLIKETSVVGFIGALDLTLAFRKIATANYTIEVPYLILGITYFLIVIVITKILKKIERKLAQSDRN